MSFVLSVEVLNNTTHLFAHKMLCVFFFSLVTERKRLRFIFLIFFLFIFFVVVLGMTVSFFI